MFEAGAQTPPSPVSPKQEAAANSVRVRNPIVAGRFYEADPAKLKTEVAGYIRQAKASDAWPKAVIVPHAGFRYSGQVAATAYARVKEMRGVISRVVLVGPSHRKSFSGIGITSADYYVMPFGRIPVDREAMESLKKLPYVSVQDEAHALEHSLEAELPFLRETLGDFLLVPVLVGRGQPEMAGEVIVKLWGGPETLVVVSSDLTHYLDGEITRERSAVTAKRIENLDYAGITIDDACGWHSVRGLLYSAKKLGYTAKTLDLRHSGDTAGETGKVVGYGVFSFEPADADKSQQTRADLMNRRRSALYHDWIYRIARESIEYGLKNGKAMPVKLSAIPEDLRGNGATFITLNMDGVLRGCIGTLAATRALGQDIASNSFGAAFNDKRFKPVTAEEFKRVSISIQLINPLETVPYKDLTELARKLRPEDGHLLTAPGHRGTLLPGMWEKGMDAQDFLRLLLRKAGVMNARWPAGAVVERYQTVPVAE